MFIVFFHIDHWFGKGLVYFINKPRKWCVCVCLWLASICTLPLPSSKQIHRNPLTEFRPTSNCLPFGQKRHSNAMRRSSNAVHLSPPGPPLKSHMFSWTVGPLLCFFWFCQQGANLYYCIYIYINIVHKYMYIYIQGDTQAWPKLMPWFVGHLVLRVSGDFTMPKKSPSRIAS